MNSHRALVLTWVASVAVMIGSPLLISRAAWPAEARSYANWLLYEAPWPHLPLVSLVLPLAALLLASAAVFLWLGLRHSRTVLLFSLIAITYSAYTTVPTISSGLESVAEAFFYFVSGLLCLPSERCEHGA